MRIWGLKLLHRPVLDTIMSKIYPIMYPILGSFNTQWWHLRPRNLQIIIEGCLVLSLLIPLKSKIVIWLHIGYMNFQEILMSTFYHFLCTQTKITGTL